MRRSTRREESSYSNGKVKQTKSSTSSEPKTNGRQAASRKSKVTTTELGISGHLTTESKKPHFAEKNDNTDENVRVHPKPGKFKGEMNDAKSSVAKAEPSALGFNQKGNAATSTASTSQSGKVDENGNNLKRPNTEEPEASSAKRLKLSHVVVPQATISGCILAFGTGDAGQLGLGEDYPERQKPTLVQNLKNIVQVVSAGLQTICLNDKGEVFSFGCNDEGALGRDTSEDGAEWLPGKVELTDKIVQVCGGDSHSAALTDQGKVFAWGTFRDETGVIGLIRPEQIEKSPIQLNLKEPIVKIASGNNHLVCLTKAGAIYTCGCAEQGQLGRVAPVFTARGGRKGLGLLLSPGQVHFRQRSLSFSNIWTGQYASYAQERETGEIYSWGLNNYFQLGFRDMVDRFVPDKITALSAAKPWKEIAGGQHHTLALTSDGRVFAFGRADYGRIGLGPNVTHADVPMLIPSLQNVIQVTAGTTVSGALTDRGEIYAWGMGSNKQLGQDRVADEEEPSDLWQPALVTGNQLKDRRGLMVSLGGQHSVILASAK